MTRTEFLAVINQQTDQAIAQGMCANGTDEFIEETVLTELENNGSQLPESTVFVLCGILMALQMRRRQFLADHPAH